MPVTRIAYEDLPLAVRNAVEAVTGTVTTVSSVGAGLNSSVAALLHTTGSSYFIKALPSDHRWAWTQAREAEVAEHVRSVAPALLSRVVGGNWDVLVFEALDGHQADYAPGSADLPQVADLLTRLGHLPCPDITLRRAEQRLQAYADPSVLHYFAGDALLHTDWNNANVIVNGDTARIVDWGWATRGAAWLDAAYWVIWLIAAGHTPVDAEQSAARVPSWQLAPTAGIDAFATANARLWAATAGPTLDSFTAPMADAAERWHHHRSSRLR